MIVVLAALVAVLAAGAAYLFTPISFGRVPLDGEYRMTVTVDGEQLTATMENNASAQALRRMLRSGPRTIAMRDFGSMEKVGMLWRGLPRNDERITAQPGDIILYQGSAIVVYYQPNTYTFTRLGHIDGVSPEDLRALLGSGAVEVTFELADR